MEQAKKLRSPLRAAFTKAAKALEEMLSKEVTETFKEELQACMDSIDRRAEQVAEMDKVIIEKMMANSDVTEEDLAAESEGISTYEDKLFLCRRKVEKVLNSLADKEKSEYSSAASCSSSKKNKKYKLPKIEFTKFGGEFKDWLGFWAQFQKIHNDDDMANEDKFHYLRQCTIENSKARDVVDSFPMTSGNYEKVVEHLKLRFGNKDTLVEVYVRELLKLVLSNALNPTKRLTLSSLYDKIETQLRALETLEVTRNEFVAILYPLVESSLPEELLRAWERHRIIPVQIPVSGIKIDRLTHLMLFLKGEVESEERITLARSGFGENIKKSQKKEEKSYDVPTAAGLFAGSNDKKSKKNCVFCSEQHYNSNCPNAKKMTLNDRQKICEEQRLCFACLGKGHFSNQCHNRMKLKCHLCGGRHCQLMCNGKFQKSENKTDNKSPEMQNVEKIESKVNAGTSNLLVKGANKEEAVLTTLLVRIRNGEVMKVVRAAIDSGSHRTYLLKSIIKELGLKSNGQETLFHELFGGHRMNESVHSRFKICAENLDGSFATSFDVLEQDKICYDVPRIQKGPWVDELLKENIVLTDVGSGSSEIQMLIGNNVSGDLLRGIHKVDGHSFVVIDFSLGWSILGKVPDYGMKVDKVLISHTMFIREAEVTDLWRLDLIGIENAAETRKKEKDLKNAKECFKKTLKIDKESRYEIALPFVRGCPSLKSNRWLAEQRLVNMTKKLSPQLKEVYQQIFDDWMEQGIIEEVPEDELQNFGHYLPHKAVLNPKSTTTPVRPVFDASAKEKNLLSLNDCLEKGPNLLEVITSIIMRFRMRRYGLLSDVKKAFLQISIQQKDRDYLRFLWWCRGSNTKMKVFRHRRLVFGLTCSSFLLAAVIIEMLEKAPQEFIETATKVMNSNYVDNCVTSVDDEEMVVKFKEEAAMLFAAGKFELRGWESNSAKLNNDLTKQISVLGLVWNLADDTLTCDIDKGKEVDDSHISKRTILAVAHKIFDPVGFTVPLSILPKLLLQDCWELKIGWNEKVPEDIAKKFMKWCQDLTKIKRITIPRWIRFSPVNQKSTSLHIFSDASRSAYATGAFIRIEMPDEVIVHLVQAKARVAPLKKLSINRLELLGCLIGARLAKNVKNDMQLQDIQTTYWSDSSNAFHWIRNEDQWGVYVWNRVTEIKSLTNVNSWRYVPGPLNPADLPSRGCNASQLSQSSWWEGPEWLKLPEDKWPNVTAEPDEEVLDSERKKVVIAAWERSRVKTDTSWLKNLKLNYGEMVHFVALMKRLIRNRSKLKKERITGNLSVNEIEVAEKHILMLVQNEVFVINDPVLNQMELLQDEYRVLRVKTKILLRDDISSFKTPTVLPNKHHIVDAIIQHYHTENSHAQTTTLMALLREKFWIVKPRNAVKKIVRKCFICNWFSAKPFVTEPSQLPLERVRDAAIFEVAGVDLTGHVILEDGSKAWIVLYTCAVYRGICLDFVKSLTTEAFILSLRRFISDKGRPKIIYSDNGTNLKGTGNCLDEIDWEKINRTASSERIDWRFIPSKAPWWGGWWERLIGVVKNLLKRVLGKSNLDYEEMRTILSEVAAIINSRPLTYMSNDPSELGTLSPSMFLKEIKEDGVPDLDVINAKKLNERHEYRVKLKEELRKRFRSEYISQLVHRKGNIATRPIELGELVLVSNDNQKRTLWPIAKVIELVKSKDGVVRVVKVKTAKGQLQRPVKLLVPLEIRENENILPLGMSTKVKEEILALKEDKIKKKKQKKVSNRHDQVEMVETSLVKKVTRSGREVKNVQRLGGSD